MRKLITCFVVCLFLIVSVNAQTRVTDKSALKTALQLKLDDWYKAGSFPGATLGVVLANGKSFGLAVGFSDRDTRKPMMLVGEGQYHLAVAGGADLLQVQRSSLHAFDQDAF